MRPAMLPALPAFGEAVPAAVLPAWRGLLARMLAAGRAVLESRRKPGLCAGR